MGICSSCFSSDRHAPAHSDDNESDPLLTSGQPRYGTGSGDRASNAGSEGAHTQHGPDPETLRREREEMERICARLAGKLIDVTGTSSHSPVADFQGTQANHTTAEGSQSRIDFSQLLKATLENRTSTKTLLYSALEVSPENSGEVNSHVNGDHDPSTKEDRGLLNFQKKWLKNIIEADVVERRWDWNKVQSIDGKLVFSFEDF